MGEIKRDAKVYITDYACDDCMHNPNTGCMLKSTGAIIMTLPAKYQYKCPNCDKNYEFDRHYPSLICE